MPLDGRLEPQTSCLLAELCALDNVNAFRRDGRYDDDAQVWRAPADSVPPKGKEKEKEKDKDQDKATKELDGGMPRY